YQILESFDFALQGLRGRHIVDVRLIHQAEGIGKPPDKLQDLRPWPILARRVVGVHNYNQLRMQAAGMLPESATLNAKSVLFMQRVTVNLSAQNRSQEVSIFRVSRVEKQSAPVSGCKVGQTRKDELRRAAAYAHIGACDASRLGDRRNQPIGMHRRRSPY